MSSVNKLIVIVNRTCNNRCEHCSPINRESNKYAVISIKEFKKIVSDFNGIEEICLFGGEPTLIPNFFIYTSIVNRSGAIPGIVTNGWFLEKPEDAKFFFKSLAVQGVERFHIILSIDTFHEPEFFKRNRSSDLKHYPYILLNNLHEGNIAKLKVSLEINWVYSNNKRHNLPVKTRSEITKLLNTMIMDGTLFGYKIVLDPLHREPGSLITGRNWGDGQQGPWVLETPEKSSRKFNNCDPWYLAIRNEDGQIYYSYCIYAGEMTKFSESNSNSLKEDLHSFLDSHPMLAKMQDGSVYPLLEKIIKNKASMKYLLETPQVCYKEDRACALCRGCLKKGMI